MEIEQATCAICGYEMEPVRPGKHQCNHCEAVLLSNEQGADDIQKKIITT